MKKLVLSAFTIVGLLATQGIIAQESGAYVKVNVGYGFATDKQKWQENVTQNSTTSSTSEIVNLSLGKGVNFGGAFGYNFNKNVAAEIGIGYLLGGETTATDKQLDGDIEKITISAKMLQINPTLVISAGMEKINPYAKFGLLLSSGTTTANDNFTSTGGSREIIIESKGGIQLGFQGGLGLEYKLSENLGIFGELNLNSLSYSPNESTITKDETKTGGIVQNNLIGDDVYDIKTVYEDSITSSTSPPDRNAPRKELKFTLPFGSLGLNLGVKYNF